MTAATAPTTITTPLTMGQLESLRMLWKTHHRDWRDVQPSVENYDKAVLPNSHAVAFCQRLHAFFGAFLQRALLASNNGGQDKGSDQSFVQDPSQSCLEPYARLALSSIRRVQSDDGSNQVTTTVVRLLTGRHVLSVPQEPLLQEFVRFDLSGQEPTPAYLQRDSLGAYLYHLPQQALACLGCSLALAILTVYQTQQERATSNPEGLLQEFREYVDATQLLVRLVHVQPVVPMRDLKTGLVGKLVAVQGHVVKARPPQLRVATAEFACLLCGAGTVHSMTQATAAGGLAQYAYSVPTQCRGGGGPSSNQQPCRSRSFSLQRPSARYVNVQELRLQEAQEESTVYAGRTPRQIPVELVHDLVDDCTCRPGDTVLVAAIVMAQNSATASGGSTGGGGGGGGPPFQRRQGKRARQENSTFSLYLQAHSITTLSESNHGSGGGRKAVTARQQQEHQNQQQQVVYTQQQLENITRLCHADHRYFGLPERRAFPFDLLVRSLCPSIIGHNLVKAGLLLCLLGGTPPEHHATGAAAGDNSGKNNVGSGHVLRSNSHILIVGDPGMGKSQMLLGASQLAARSVFVGGNTSSTTGLTVTLTKEERGESAIEAGALVLADQGICCIDEFDKMAKNHQDGLLEAMEQQQVSIAKAGVVASLPARCSVIAAANPRHGSYNMGKTVSENLNMARPILSRFDLVFILRDRVDKEQDRLVSSNIMNLYSKAQQGVTQGRAQPAVEASFQHNQNSGEAENRMSFADRLAWVTDFQKDPLPADLVRDYIAYAREYCKPKMTPEAAEILRDYYMNLRYPADGRRKKDTVPITTRQLEALIRLCQARAKACLRDFVLKEDALDVVELMACSVEQIHSDETGKIDSMRGGAGGKSNRKLKKAFVSELHRVVGIGAECTLDDLRRIADKVNYTLSDFSSMVEDLRTNGVLMKKSNGNYQVV